ncbi:MAG TPA: hypothetical protein PLD23_20100 [Armatimonadota bacterium]|nr:hypothetical protein [Armatimonadota bacterium]HQK95812.1 hypothetical protein [Armatimonadota bacterium]
MAASASLVLMLTGGAPTCTAAGAPPVRVVFCSMADVGRAAPLGDGCAIVVPLSISGQSYVAPAPRELVPAAEAAAVDQWRVTLASAHAHGARVLGSVDTLRWGDVALPAGVQAAHPDWFETRPPGSPDEPGDAGRYLSVWHPATALVMRSLASDLWTAVPDLDGLVLRHCYSHTEWVGFSESTRAACVRELRQDPLDLVRLGGASTDPKLRIPLMRVAAWRQSAVDAALRAFVGAYRAVKPGAEIWAWGRPETYLMDPLERAQACEDWLGWLADGAVDGVFLEGPWQGPGGAAGPPVELYRMVRDLVARIAPAPQVVPTIPTDDAGADVDLVAQLLRLEAQGPVPALGVVVKQTQRLADALELLRTFAPYTWPPG